MSTEPTEARGTASRCTLCECDVEWCSFCDSRDCPERLCYADVVRALRESLPQPHVHGG